MKTKCLYPNCNKDAWTRGLCSGHRTVAYRLVKKGLTTWEQLEKSGKCLPLKLKPVSTDWFLKTNKQCPSCKGFNTEKRHAYATFGLPECYYDHCSDCNYTFNQT